MQAPQWPSNHKEATVTSAAVVRCRSNSAAASFLSPSGGESDHRRPTTCIAGEEPNNTDDQEHNEAEALVASTAVLLFDDANNSCNRVCRPAHHHSSAAFRYCEYLVLMLTAFLIGLTIGQNRQQVNAAHQTTTHHRINFHEYNNNHTLPNAVLVVGGAGFIGMHAALLLASRGSEVIALDNMNGNMYSPELKEERARLLDDKASNEGINLVRGDACDQTLIERTIIDNNIDGVIYLASQNGKRDDGMVHRPFQYPMNNMDCFVSVLDSLRKMDRDKSLPLVYASDSFGYKFNVTVPGALASDEVVEPSQEGNAEEPRYNEMIARAYYKLYGTSSVGLRFETIVGSFGRPDMTYYNTVNKMRGDARKYSHVDDVVHSIVHELRTMSDGFKVVSVNSNDGSSTSDAMNDFTKWYKMANAKQYVATEPSKRPELATMQSSTEAKDICFVTSLFSDNPKLIEREGPYPITNYTNKHPSFKYYYFTNVHGLPSNGWELIVMDDMDKSFTRFITQSRWPKFMGFRHNKLQECKAIIYSDANRPPKDLGINIWGDLVKRVLGSSSGIMQDKRPGKATIFEEMHSIVVRKKDISANIDISKKWFLEQEDFHDDAKGWWNMALIYDPSNMQLQELFTTLWARYSDEEGSWRDQPLYRYLVDKLDVEPLPLSGDGHSAYFARVRSSGKHHHYDANTNGVSWT